MCKIGLGESKLVVARAVGAALVHSDHVAGSGIESWYGYAVLHLTRNVHELSIRILLFVLHKGDTKI